jgi:plastocyanin
MKIVLLAAALAAALMVPAALAGHTAAKATKLQGTVGPGFTITLKQNGKKVSKLAAGAYTIVVADKATDHDFHLTGPGVDKSTTVGGKGTKTWNLTLKKGTYRYVCDPHATFMKGSFKVG